MTQPQLNTPWSLHFDRDGTEDIAIIRDAQGDDLVTSRHFWQPEGNDPVPPTLAAMRAIFTTPDLLAFVTAVAGMTQDGEAIEGREFVLENDDPVDTLNQLIDEMRQLVATGREGSMSPTPEHTLRLEMEVSRLTHIIDRQDRLITQMKDSLDYLLEQTVDQDLKYGIGLTEGEEDARANALAVIAEAAGRTMTRYLVTAWCDRPFFARCEVDAETPQAALAKARQAIADAPAEECDEGYYWDEWRVDTPEADGVLLHRDAPARLRSATAALLAACRMVVDRWEQGDLAEAARACRDAVASATGRPA